MTRRIFLISSMKRTRRLTKRKRRPKYTAGGKKEKLDTASNNESY